MAAMDDETLRQRLYRIFHIEEEDYAITVKVFYIYRWVEHHAGDATLDVISDLRRVFRDRENTVKLDKLFHEMQGTSLRRLTAPTSVHTPQKQSKYNAGWRIG